MRERPTGGRRALPGRTARAYVRVVAVRAWIAVIGVFAVACAPDAPSATSDRAALPDEAAVVEAGVEEAGPVRLAFVGDVMLGRSVAPIVVADPGSVFERLRPVLVGADVAFGNLESPLTRRPHLVGEYALEADPEAARLLAGAGFDVLGVANNHASDAGPDTVLDTLSALDEVGLAGVGGGLDSAVAGAPLVLDVAGVSVGVLAFDLSGGASATMSTPIESPSPMIVRTSVLSLPGSAIVSTNARSILIR